MSSAQRKNKKTLVYARVYVESGAHERSKSARVIACYRSLAQEVSRPLFEANKNSSLSCSSCSILK